MFMQKLRSNVGKIILWLMVIAFLGWIVFDLGADLVGKRISKPWERGVIAEVEGKEIPYDLYRVRLEKALADSSQTRGGADIPREEEERIEESVWREMVDDVRWERVLKDRGLELEDEAVLKLLTQFPPPEIREDSSFWSEGKFNYQLYLQALGDPRNLEYFKSYELQLRRDIPRDFMRLDLMSSVSVSKAEAFYDYKLKNTRAHILYIAVNANAAVPDSEVRITDQEVSDYYEAHKDKYKVGERVGLVMVRLAKVPSPEDTLDAKEQLEIAVEEINQGGKFEEVVQYYTEDPQGAENGGDMGWVELESLPREVAQALEGAKEGDVVGPVESPLGWHLFQVEKRDGDSLHLRQILRRVHLSTQTEQALHEQMATLRDLAKEQGGLAEAAKTLDMRVDTVAPFDLDKGFVPMLGPEPEVIQTLRDAKEGYLSPLIRKPGFYALLEVTRKIPEGYLSLEEIKDRVRRDLTSERKKDMARDMVHKALDALREGREPALPPAGAFFQEDTATTYNTYLPGVADKDLFWGAIMGMKPGSVVGPLEGQFTLYDIKLVSRNEPAQKSFESLARFMVQQASQGYFQSLFAGWQEELTRDLKIKDYRPYIFMY